MIMYSILIDEFKFSDITEDIFTKRRLFIDENLQIFHQKQLLDLYQFVTIKGRTIQTTG